MLPFRPVAPIGRTALPEAARGPIRALALTSLALAVLCVLVGGTASGVVLALAVTALGAATVLALRARWTAEALAAPAAGTPGPAAAGIDAVASDDLTERLRRLHDDHVEAVNMAIGEGRDDLVQELSDSYMTQALGLITGGGRASQDEVPRR